MSLGTAPSIFRVLHTTLYARIKKNTEINTEYSTKYTRHRVFKSEQETLMKEYIRKSSKM
jgi:hypothetical protein